MTLTRGGGGGAGVRGRGGGRGHGRGRDAVVPLLLRHRVPRLPAAPQVPHSEGVGGGGVPARLGCGWWGPGPYCAARAVDLRVGLFRSRADKKVLGETGVRLVQALRGTR